MTIFVEDNRILLVPPPGAAAVLSSQQTRWLGSALEQAVQRTENAAPRAESRVS